MADISTPATEPMTSRSNRRLASGKVDEALFDKVVQPIEMVGVGLGGA
jgi:hypothetical protein